VDEGRRVLVEELSAVVAGWEEASAAAGVARKRRDQLVGRAQAALDTALGGMTLQRWRRLVEGDVSIRTRVVGREVNIARRRRADVQAALDMLEVAMSVEAMKVEVADRDLATATRSLLAYGPLAERVTGRSAHELRRMLGRLK
jgi:hypothetical protein